MATGDGKIVLQVEVDESGAVKGANSIKSAFRDVSSYLQTAGSKIKTTFQNIGDSIKNRFQQISSSLKGVIGQIVSLLSVRAFINFSREASQMASDTEASIQRLISIYGSASQSVGDFIDSSAHALGMSRSAAAQFAAVYGNLFSVWADQETNAQLTQHYLQATAVVASQTGRTMVDVQERIRSGLLGNTEAVEDLGIFVNIKTIEMTEAFQRVAQGAKWDDLTAAQQNQVRSLAILEQATKKYGSQVANTTAFTRLQYEAAFQDFKATWGQVVNIVLMPILRVVTTILNTLAAGLRAIAGLTGKTIATPPKDSGTVGGGGGATVPEENGGSGKKDDSERKAIEAEEKAIQKKIKALQKESDAEKQLGDEIDALQKKLKQLRKETPEEKAADDEAKAIKKSIKALQKQNKEIKKNSQEKQEAAKKELASFDDIEILNFNQQSEEEKAMEANDDAIDALQEKLDLINENKEAMREARQEEIDALNDTLDAKRDALDALRDADNDEIDKLREQLDLLGEKKMALEEAAAAGAGGGGGGADIGAIDLGQLQEPDPAEYTEKLALIGMVAGWALVGLGIIVIFAGHLLIGAAMVAAGAMLAIGAAVGAQELGQEEKEKLMKIGTIVGVALIGLGVLLLFTPFWKLGLGMIAAGAMALFTVLTLGEFKEDVKKKLTNILLITGTVMMTIGVILLFVPGGEGFGLAMMAAGAAEVIVAAIMNADKIIAWLKENLWSVVAVVGEFIFVVGMILLFVPGGMNWGIAAMLAGIAIIGVAAIVPNWDELKSKLIEFFNDNWGAIAALSAALVVLGVTLCIAQHWLIGLSLVAVGAAGMYASIKPNWDELKKKIKSFFDDNWGAIAAVSAALTVLGIILCFANLWLVGIGLIAAGAAGLYASVAPNWDEIKQKIDEFFNDNWGAISAVSAVLVVLGIILCFANLWLVGIGLIATGAAGLYTAITPNWDEIKQKISNFFEDNSKLFAGVGLALCVLGILLLFTGVGVPLGFGLLLAGGASLAAAIAPNWDYIVDKIKETWGKIKKYWNENIAPIFTAEWWMALGQKCINGLCDAIEKGINAVINLINKLSFDVPDWVPGIGGQTWGFNIPTVTIPKLAQGAVIPGGREFLAVLGDQPSGQTNIEAPLDTIVQAFNIALAQNGGVRGVTEVILEIDGRELGRATVEHGNAENRRIGTRLVIA